jgi:hypothetical protein
MIRALFLAFTLALAAGVVGGPATAAAAMPGHVTIR